MGPAGLVNAPLQFELDPVVACGAAVGKLERVGSVSAVGLGSGVGEAGRV